MCKKVRFIRKQAFIPGICFSNWSSTASVTRASAGRPLPLSAKTVYKPSSLNSTPIIYKQRFEYKASLTFCSNGILGFKNPYCQVSSCIFSHYWPWEKSHLQLCIFLVLYQYLVTFPFSNTHPVLGFQSHIPLIL